jgi:hypothetical protein
MASYLTVSQAGSHHHSQHRQDLPRDARRQASQQDQSESEQEVSDGGDARSTPRHTLVPGAGTGTASKSAVVKRQRGSGVEYLMNCLRAEREDVSAPHAKLSTSATAKCLLSGLLSENDLVLGAPADSWLSRHQPRKKRKPIETSMSDERVMQLAQEGELSFLASLLKVIEEEGGSITTKFLIKACCLSVEPARVPSLCDAKEMVMAALHFLSRSFQPEGDTFPALPLVRCINEAPDLEKRSYEQCGDWTTREPAFVDQVLQLEQVFYNAIDYKYLARENMCPTLPSGRDLLLLKGSAPAYCMGKTKKGAPTRRKKGEDPHGAVPGGGNADDGAEY